MQKDECLCEEIRGKEGDDEELTTVAADRTNSMKLKKKIKKDEQQDPQSYDHMLMEVAMRMDMDQKNEILSL